MKREEEIAEYDEVLETAGNHVKKLLDNLPKDKGGYYQFMTFLYLSTYIRETHGYEIWKTGIEELIKVGELSKSK